MPMTTPPTPPGFPCAPDQIDRILLSMERTLSLLERGERRLRFKLTLLTIVICLSAVVVGIVGVYTVQLRDAVTNACSKTVAGDSATAP